MYEELVKLLKYAAQTEATNHPTWNELMQKAADAIEDLDNKLNLYRQGKISRWIPVTERLPEQDGTFITAYSKGGVSQNWYMVFHHGGGKWYQNSEDTGEVTHWMPLPEPPKEGET